MIRPASLLRQSKDELDCDKTPSAEGWVVVLSGEMQRSENSCRSCEQVSLLGQIRLFVGVKCYRPPLDANGIETQKRGQTLCDVPTAESI
jgi:hypothetical protein